MEKLWKFGRSDFIVAIVDGNSYPLHGIMFAKQNRERYQKLFSDIKDDTLSINLTDLEKEWFETALDFVYSEESFSLNSNNILPLYSISEKLFLSGLRDQCKVAFERLVLNPDDCGLFVSQVAAMPNIPPVFKNLCCSEYANHCFNKKMNITSMAQSTFSFYVSTLAEKRDIQPSVVANCVSEYVRFLTNENVIPESSFIREIVKNVTVVLKRTEFTSAIANDTMILIKELLPQTNALSIPIDPELIKILATNFYLVDEKIIISLQHETLIEIISHKDLVVNSADEICALVMKWIDEDRKVSKTQNQGKYRDLIGKLKLPQISHTLIETLLLKYLDANPIELGLFVSLKRSRESPLSSEFQVHYQTVPYKLRSKLGVDSTCTVILDENTIVGSNVTVSQNGKRATKSNTSHCAILSSSPLSGGIFKWAIKTLPRHEWAGENWIMVGVRDSLTANIHPCGDVGTYGVTASSNTNFWIIEAGTRTIQSKKTMDPGDIIEVTLNCESNSLTISTPLSETTINVPEGKEFYPFFDPYDLDFEIVELGK